MTLSKELKASLDDKRVDRETPDTSNEQGGEWESRGLAP
jgi:hypothetical protein